MICDYCFGRKGNIHVPSLYTSSKAGIYWYKSGVNFRGVFAWCAGVAMGLPGLVAAYNPTSVSQAGKNMYKLGWILTFVTAFVVHLILIKLFKEKVYPDGYESLPTKWEYLAKEGREGFFDGEGTDHNSLASEAEGGIVKVDVHVGEKEQQVSV
jgi:NCS1 family nucleobase:cation symporter-1